MPILENLSLIGIDSRKFVLLIWLIAILGWMLGKRDIRISLWHFVRSLAQPKIWITFLLGTLYTGMLLFGLKMAGYWHFTMLADSVFWFVGTATVLIANAHQMTTSKKFRERLGEYFSLMVILDFIVNLYSFNFWVELLLFPLLTFIFLLYTVAKMNSKHASVATVTNAFLGVMGVLLLLKSVFGFFTNLSTTDLFGTVESLLLMPLLTLLFVPFVYLLAVYSMYDSFFCRVRIFDKNLSPGWRWVAIKASGIKLDGINEYTSERLRQILSR